MKEDSILDNSQQMNGNYAAAQNRQESQYEAEATMYDTTYGEENTAQPVDQVETARPKKKDNTWVNVTLGGVSGILLGAAVAYGANAYAANKADIGEVKTDGENEPGGENEPPFHTTPGGADPDAPVETNDSLDDLSFSEAFAAARADAGPGHTFVWHGGVYSTYTVEEWSHLSHQEQTSHAQGAGPQPPTPPNDGNPDVNIYVGHVHINNGGDDAGDTVTTGHPYDTSDGGDVHVVATGEYDGHTVAYVDLDGNGGADIAIVDMDDNNQVSAPDIVYDAHGNVATVAELTDDTGGDDYYEASNEQGNDDLIMVDYADAGNDGNTDDVMTDDNLYLSTLDDAGSVDAVDDSSAYLDDPMIS